jgi:hypothetical protein
MCVFLIFNSQDNLNVSKTIVSTFLQRMKVQNIIYIM